MKLLMNHFVKKQVYILLIFFCPFCKETSLYFIDFVFVFLIDDNVPHEPFCKVLKQVIKEKNIV
jgi:hypothetical protein